jgi:hypothetical protein
MPLVNANFVEIFRYVLSTGECLVQTTKFDPLWKIKKYPPPKKMRAAVKYEATGYVPLLFFFLSDAFPQNRRITCSSYTDTLRPGG